MVALAIAAADVVPDDSAGSYILRGEIAGEAIDAGEVVFKDRGVNPPVWKLAQADSEYTVAEGDDIGIAVSEAAAAGQKLSVQVRGLIDVGAGVAGEVYVVSAAAAGALAPNADIIAGQRVCVMAIGAADGKLKLGRTGANLGPDAHA